MTDKETHSIDAPGATIAYDVRRNDASNEPPLMIIGSPMGAAGFVTLASYFPDRTLVTYDPRGADRSKKADDLSQSTPVEHADDLHRVISEVGGPVDLFATSGGAVNALALVASHPEDVRVLVAHEPPIAQILPDREAALAATSDVHESYLRSGQGLGMAKFIALVSYSGQIPSDYIDQPDPDPHMFGMSAEDDGSRNDVLLGQNMITGSHFQPDFDALRNAATRIVIAVGEESGETMARRAGEAVAAQLGIQPTVFPSDHGGFMGGEYGQMGKPAEFAAKLREVLASS